jgi:phosphoglycolate phosphatase-like HAD superfamily hydrolase
MRIEPAFLFDLDGTLVDSVYQHVLAWREALDAEGIELSIWRIHRKISNTRATGTLARRRRVLLNTGSQAGSSIDRASRTGRNRGTPRMSDGPSAAIAVVEEHGSFLLVRAGSRFAVVERRAGRIYSVAPGERDGLPMTAEGMATLMAEEGSLPEPEARRLFKELSERGDRLARVLR